MFYKEELTKSKFGGWGVGPKLAVKSKFHIERENKLRRLLRQFCFCKTLFCNHFGHNGMPNCGAASPFYQHHHPFLPKSGSVVFKQATKGARAMYNTMFPPRISMLWSLTRPFI